MVGEVTCRHVLTCICTTWCTRVHVQAQVCARVCMYAISGLSILIGIFVKPRNDLSLSTHHFAYILSYGTMFVYECPINTNEDV